MARVVMFVLNDCRHDARVLREAATLAEAGHTVTVVARTVDPYAPTGEREGRDGFTILRAPVAAGRLRWTLLGRRPPVLARALRAQAVAWLHGGPGGLARLAGATLVALAAVVVLALPAAVLALLLGLLLALRRRPAFRPLWLWLEWRLQWRFGVMPWTAQAVAAAPPADIAHAHDLRALPAARAVRDRDGARLVYDSHEIFTEAGANATRPARARAEMLRLERRLAAGADALITVNDDVAAVLRERLGQDDIVVIRNVLPPRGVRLDEPSSLRAACGLDAATPLLLCHGTFVPHRGFEPVAAALALAPLAGVHAAFLGIGPLRPALDTLAADASLAGRLHVLDAVPPSELLAWIAGADVAVVAIQPSTLNHRLSTPNKLFEALAAGVPVVASDFPPMRRIVLDDPDGPLGAVCDPTSPAAIAEAARRLLDLEPDAAADLRRRCSAAAAARYTWDIDGARLVELYKRLDPGPGASRAGARTAAVG